MGRVMRRLTKSRRNTACGLLRPTSHRTMERGGLQQRPLAKGGGAGGVPDFRLRRRELREHVVLAVAPDRPLGIVDRDERGKADEVGEAGAAQTRIEARGGTPAPAARQRRGGTL